ncbi:TlpA family protein disulfide reductase [Tamlana agarivorans]|uniref:TlpA family protein disulfide reductase n=1 Tax=Pseudotamlana agarivorans TaxID=481183 RepID=A0ACC5UA90_9FLAO|nr:TlpA disulfide reductase family protein [Tamlana agarivorans]MBU2951169.1 TlpA family protein disulfide reductase [Tamlana agarivorans]
MSNQLTTMTGEMELIFDLSGMKNAKEGRLKITGDYIFEEYEIENDQLTVNLQLKEPTSIYISFFSAKKLKENPNKSVFDLATAFGDYSEILAVPGKYNIIIDSIMANIQIVNESHHQKKFTELQHLKESFQKKLQEEILDEMKPELEDAGIEFPFRDDIDKNVRDSVLQIFRAKYRKPYNEMYREKVFNFIKQNPDEPVSLLELAHNSSTVGRVGSNSGQFDMEQFIYLYNNLTDRIKTLPSASSVYAQVFGGSMVGKQAPEFKQNDPSGNLVSLEEFKGNITLLEFWASWCGPCRAANPELVRAFEKYHDKGFRILAVSLDTNKKSWLNAIEKDGLEWTHVSELNRFKNKAAQLYHVSGIPSNFLIDRNGKIIQYNLQEEELNVYLKKLLE